MIVTLLSILVATIVPILITIFIIGRMYETDGWFDIKQLYYLIRDDIYDMKVYSKPYKYIPLQEKELQEKEQLIFPKRLDIVVDKLYKLKEIKVYYIKDLGKNISLDTDGFYWNDIIYIKETDDIEDLESTLIHEYSHYIIESSNIRLRKINIEHEYYEEQTDILGYYLAKDKGLKFKGNYLSNEEIRDIYKKSESIQSDIKDLVQYEKNIY